MILEISEIRPLRFIKATTIYLKIKILKIRYKFLYHPPLIQLKIYVLQIFLHLVRNNLMKKNLLKMKFEIDATNTAILLSDSLL